MKEWHIRVTGRVQGVGFRAHVFKLAQQHHITGFVRNGQDGSVEICAQGNDREIQAFLNHLKESRQDSIEQIEPQKREEPKEKFATFIIRRD